MQFWVKGLGYIQYQTLFATVKEKNKLKYYLGIRVFVIFLK